jgi:hypothetical protein
MGIRKIVWTLILLLVFSAPVLATILPRSMEEIPIYPGAVRDQQLEEYYRDNTYISEDVISREIRVYKVDTIIDDVARYYLEYLQPEQGWPEEEPHHLAPGESLGPWYEPDFYRPEIFEDQYEYDTLIQDGKWIRQAFGERPQWDNGQWLSQMWFQWIIVDEKGDLISHAVLVEDEGYDWRAQVDFKTTRLLLETTVFEGDMIWDDDWDQDWDNDWEWDDWDEDGPWDEEWDWEMENGVSLEILYVD